MSRNATQIKRTMAVAMAFCLLTTLSVQAGYRQRIAVCVGINSYTDYPQLSCAVNDASSMADVFEAYGFDRVVLLTEAQADRETIMDELSGIAGTIGSEDLFVFFYAGHGWTGADGAADKMGYILPVESRKGLETEAGISMQTLRGVIEAMPNRHSLLLMDACYSGFGLQVAGAAGDGMASRSVQMLAAGGELDRAFESNGHGLFTRHILKYFERSGSRGISALKLAAYVHKRVKRETSGWQTPRFGRVGEGEIMIAMVEPAAANRLAAVASAPAATI